MAFKYRRNRTTVTQPKANPIAKPDIDKFVSYSGARPFLLGLILRSLSGVMEPVADVGVGVREAA